MIDFYCIHKEDNLETKEALADAVQSGKQNNINVIPYPGVYSNIDNIISQENLFVNSAGAHKIYRRGKGVLGCFLSHYFLWEMSVERNISVGVLEYDAIFIKELPSNILDTFDDYLNLDYTRHTHLSLASNGSEYLKQIEVEKTNTLEIKSLIESSRSLTHHFKYINNNHIKGAFGYIIKPSGANKLIQATKEHGILPADVQANLLYCDMKYTSPSVVMLNPKGLTNRYGGSHTNTGRLSS